MKDEIISVDTFEEAINLGWTRIGRIWDERCWQSTAWIWCKNNRFVLLKDRVNGYCAFLQYINVDEAMKRFYDTEKDVQMLKDVEYSIN
jgi:hypothetical protein